MEPDMLLELRCCLTLWEHYQRVIAEVDQAIAAQLRAMARQTTLPPLPPQPRQRGRKPHDRVSTCAPALYYATGVDLTAVERH